MISLAVSSMMFFKYLSSFGSPIRGSIISGFTSIPWLWTFLAAVNMALVCIIARPGYVISNLEPRSPIIGLNCFRDSIFSFNDLMVTFKLPASFLISSSFLGKNSWSGGSKYLIVKILPFAALKSSSKSLVWIGSKSFKAFSFSSSVSARIILRMANILLSSKNMCSVLHKPIPSAPKLKATRASLAKSAFALTPIFLTSLAQFSKVSKLPVILGSVVGRTPS